MRTVGNMNGSFPLSCQDSRLTYEATGPGILVLAPTMKILYVNRRAWELARRVSPVGLWGSNDQMLPPAVAEVCATVRTALEVRADQGRADRFEYKRVIGEFGRRVQIHAFGLPNRISSLQSRIVIVLDALSDAPSNHRDDGDLFVDQPVSIRDVA